MRRVGSLVVALSRNWLRSREAVFFALLFPVILLVIFSSVFAGGTASFTVFVQNQDVGQDGEPTAVSAALVESLENVSVLSVRTLAPGRNVTEWREENRTTGTKRVLVVPDGFAAGVRNQSVRVRMAVIGDTTDRMGGQLNDSQTARIRRAARQTRNATNASGPVALRFYTSPDDGSTPTVRGILDSVVARFNQRVIGADEPTVTVKSRSLGGSGLGAADYYLPAFIAAIVMINGVMTVPAVVSGLKDDGTLKRLVATPLRKRDWILANVVHQALIALVLTVEMVVVAHLLFDVTAIPGPLAVGLVLLGAVGFSALGIVLGSLIPDPDASASLGGAIGFPMMFLSGVFWELDVMPPVLRTLGEIMPLYYFHRALRQVMILETTDGVAVGFAILAAMSVVFVGVAVAVTDWQNLDG